MRKLQNLKCFGAVYDKYESSTPGSLMIFCPSCPQPGINLPPDWKNLPNWVTHRTITVDGNFHADHIKMWRQDLDIALTNGQGFTPKAPTLSSKLTGLSRSLSAHHLTWIFLIFLTLQQLGWYLYTYKIFFLYIFCRPVIGLVSAQAQILQYQPVIFAYQKYNAPFI